jgi:hypothetical protein
MALDETTAKLAKALLPDPSNRYAALEAMPSEKEQLETRDKRAALEGMVNSLEKQYRENNGAKLGTLRAKLLQACTGITLTPAESSHILALGFEKGLTLEQCHTKAMAEGLFK